jgi:hypothetical protein
MKSRLLLAACVLLAACTTGNPHGRASRPLPEAARPQAGGRPGGPVSPAAAAPVVALAWTPKRLPAGFAARVAALPGIRRALAMVDGTVWLTGSRDQAGRTVDRPPPGMAIPLDVAAAPPAALAAFLPTTDQQALATLERGEAVLGATAARLRRLGPGATLVIGGRRVVVAGVLPDADVGAHELLLSRRQAAALGLTVERYLLLEPDRGARWPALAARIRALLPHGAQLRLRAPGQATWLREADAVLAPVQEKALFGEFAAKPRPAPGGWLTLDPAFLAGHIVTARVPILGQVTCNKAIIGQLRGALAELQRRSLAGLVDPGDYAGCYAARLIAGDPGPSIAHHAWGTAIDLNATANPQGQSSHQDPRLVAVFARWGFTWGGQFLVPDPMHFELLHPRPDH